MPNEFDVIKYIKENTDRDGICAFAYNQGFFDYLAALKPEQVTEEEKTALASVGSINWVLHRIEKLPDGMRLLTGLRSAALMGCLLTDISPLSVLSNLTRLDLAYNEIEDISPLSSLTNLIDVDLIGNKFEDLTPLCGLKRLEKLYLGGNQLTDIAPLSNLKNLIKLELNSNRITDLTPIGCLPNLTKLDLQGNMLTDISALSALEKLSVLNLDYNRITDISPLKSLKKLEVLRISNNIITDMQALQGLHSLKKLWLYDNQITEICGLDECENLEELYLSNNQIRELKGLDRLKKLKKLNIGNNQITAIKGFDSLNSIISLYLSGNRITKIEGLNALTSLETLHLAENKIQKVENIGHLTQLKTLNLDSNPIYELPELDTLKSLKHVYLQNLKIRALPRSLFDLNLTYSIHEDKNNTSANVIYLNGTTLTQQPISLFATNKRKLIENYYNAPKEIIKEAKVMFLGDGGAGKTYTVKRLKNHGIQSDEYHTEETDTIEISEYVTDDDITLKLWDFGGQEYMHSMNRCFLTERSVYVVVLSGRTGNMTGRAIYWLENINSFAKNSPVILAVNCWEHDGNPGVDYATLKKRYPNLKNEIPYSAKCSDKNTFNRLTDAIIKEAKALDGYGMDMPSVWTDVMRSITNRFSEKNMITKSEYEALCKNADKTGILTDEICVWLLDWFNDLGLCFSNHKVLTGADASDGSNSAIGAKEDYNLYKPSWLFRGIYSIIKTNEDRAADDEEFEIKDGVIKKTSVIKSIRVAKKEQYRQYEQYIDDLLGIMRNFSLSHMASEKEEFIPALCPVNVPRHFISEDKSFKRKLQFEFRYTYLPDSVVQRLMVFGKSQLGYTVANPWKSGMELIYGDLAALIRRDEVKPYLTVTIFESNKNSGGESNKVFEYFKNLSEQINRINEKLNLKADGYIIKGIARNSKGSTVTSGFSVDGLLDALSKGKEIVTYLDNGVYEEYRIKDLLGMAFSNKDIEKMREDKQMENENKKGLFEGATVHIGKFIGGNDNSRTQNGDGNIMAGGNVIQDSYNQTQTVTNVQNELDKIIELLNKNDQSITGNDINNAAKEIISGKIDDDTTGKACDVLAEPEKEKKQSKFKDLLNWAKEQVTDPEKAKKWVGVAAAVGSVIAKAVGG